MSISLFFILSARGDTIISKDFRGDTPIGAAEVFFRKVKFWDKGDAPPVFEIDGVNYIYIRKNGLIIACTTRFNISPSLAIELLNRTTKVFKDYCGILSEESIRKNFILIYELLDEIYDFGVPQITSTETLKNFIYNEPQVVEEKQGIVMTNGRTINAKSAQKPITTGRQGGAGGKHKNEIFVDIIERLTVLFSAQGHVLNSSVDGCIQMKSYLAGNPELRLALNEDLVVGGDRGGMGVVVDDCNFHECVQLQEFESARTLSFYPPEGEFVLMNFRVTGEYRCPFKIFPSIEDTGPYKMDIVIRVRADIPEAHHGANVVIRMPLPKTSANVVCDMGGGPSSNQSYEYEPGSTEGNVETTPKLRWMIKKFPGNTEFGIRIRVTLSSPVTAANRKEVGPVSMNFEIPMYNVSSLQVKYLRIADQGGSYNPYRWVRYITQSSNYVCRV
mmetsp:Transcript_11898/g.14377  ORF Transcript_11898/g.14377 Transcript_11898/m.14377 type:complete len:445 (-) Transcript_11898:199-1533(-)